MLTKPCFLCIFYVFGWNFGFENIKNKDLIIQKSDQANSIVLINKSDYLDKIYSILSDSKKFVRSSVVDDNQLNFIIGIERKLTDYLKN